MRYVNILVLLMFFGFFSVVTSAQDCDDAKYIFNSITRVSDRSEIKKDYKLYIEFYEKHDYFRIYDFLAKSFLNSAGITTRDDYIKYKQDYFEENGIEFVSFTPLDVAEEVTENPGNWIITGCITENKSGKTRRTKATLLVWREDGQIKFSDIEKKIYLNGKTEECDANN